MIISTSPHPEDNVTMSSKDITALRGLYDGPSIQIITARTPSSLLPRRRWIGSIAELKSTLGSAPSDDFNMPSSDISLSSRVYPLKGQVGSFQQTKAECNI